MLHLLGPATGWDPTHRPPPPSRTQSAHLSAIREEESSAPLTPLWFPFTPSESCPVNGLHPNIDALKHNEKTLSSFQCNPDCCQMYSCYYDYYFFFFFVNVNLSVIPMTIMLCDYYYTKKQNKTTSQDNLSFFRNTI